MNHSVMPPHLHRCQGGDLRQIIKTQEEQELNLHPAPQSSIQWNHQALHTLPASFYHFHLLLLTSHVSPSLIPHPNNFRTFISNGFLGYKAYYPVPLLVNHAVKLNFLTEK